MVQKANRVRLVTYNIHMGLSPFWKRDVLAALEDVLRATDADVLCLQEDLQTDDVSESAMAQRCSSVFGQSVFSQTVVHPKGVQGNTIISRLPIETHNAIPLPGFGGQPRGLLHATIRMSANFCFDVFCIHLGLSRRQRFGQAEVASRAIQNLTLGSRACILAGDFNDWRNDTVPHVAETLGMNVVVNSRRKPFRTYPAWFPVLTLDRILFRGCNLLGAGICADVRKIGLSDHLPLTADFVFPA